MGKNSHPGQSRIVVYFTPEEKLKLMELKGDKTWKDFIMELVKCCNGDKKE